MQLVINVPIKKNHFNYSYFEIFLTTFPEKDKQYAPLMLFFRKIFFLKLFMPLTVIDVPANVSNNKLSS